MSWKFELLLKPEGELITEGPVWTGEEILFTHSTTARCCVPMRKKTAAKT